MPKSVCQNRILLNNTIDCVLFSSQGDCLANGLHHGVPFICVDDGAVQKYEPGLIVSGMNVTRQECDASKCKKIQSEGHRQQSKSSLALVLLIIAA
ncbi:hypothetical protein BGW38_009099, partial [Lunasporangiospora selenospora]